MAGSISLSLSQQFDTLGKPLNGGKIHFIQAGTTATPQNAFQDIALTIPWPNPLTLDSAGRVPQLYLADGQIKIRIINSVGVTQVVADNILVVGPSSVGGGGTVDATTILATGDLKVRYGTGVLSGFVRANGRTIGAVASGATERANSDCQQLFEYLYTTDPNLAVSGGRGASANADWVANKTITLPDWRGRALAGLDDMGNSAASRLTATYFGTAATVLGAVGGVENVTMATANLIQHTHNNTLTDPGHVHSYTAGLAGAGLGAGNPGGYASANNTASATTSISINNASAGSASPTPMRTVPPTMLATIYIKL